MLRFLTGLAMGLTIVCAFALYGFSYGTSKIALKVQTDERYVERLRTEIAVLRAERAYLARPERIEPLARAIGLLPASGKQHVRLEAGLAARQHPSAQ